MREAISRASVPGVSAVLDWDAVYQRHAPDLRRLIARRIPGRAAVEDVLQETFVRAFRSQERFDPTRAEWPWLATLAHRSCVRWWRTHRQADVLRDEEQVAKGWQPEAPGSDDHLLAMERARVVGEALAQLAPRHRRALYLYEAEDFSYDRLAEVEAISHKALKSLLGRARVHFRRHYERIVEESAAAVAAVRAVLNRLRSRLSDREIAGWERIGSFAGTALVVGVVGVLAVPGSAPPAKAGAPDIASRPSSETAPASVAGFGEKNVAEGRSPRFDGRAESVGREPNEPRAGTDLAEGTPLGVTAGGGLVHSPEAATAGVWVAVDDPLGGQSTRMGTEVRCDAGRLYELECAVLRSVPSTG